METGDVAYLHDGTPVLVLESGEGVPGEYQGTGPNAVWVDNPDYKPARVALLTSQDVEQGQLAASLDETASAARAAAIEAGDHSEQAQFVHEPADAPVNDAPIAEPPPRESPLLTGRAADDAELRGDWESVAEREGWTRPEPSTQGGTPVSATPEAVGAGASALTEAGAAEAHTASEGQPASALPEGPAAATPAQEAPPAT